MGLQFYEEHVDGSRFQVVFVEWDGFNNSVNKSTAQNAIRLLCDLEGISEGRLHAIAQPISSLGNGGLQLEYHVVGDVLALFVDGSKVSGRYVDDLVVLRFAVPSSGHPAAADRNLATDRFTKLGW